MAAIDTTLNGAPQTIVSAIQYRGDNQMIQCTYGNGLIDERQYDLQGRLIQQSLNDDTGFIIDERTYSHDKNSNILDIDTNVEDNGYQYDALDRLIEDVTDTVSPNQYTYDLNDNRLIEARADDSREDLWDYQPGSNRLDVVDAVDRTDTPLPVLPDRELVYNDANRLFQLIEDGELKASYFYNDQGQRTRKVIHNPGGSDTVTIFHYDHMGYLISETDESGNLVKDYIWLEGMTPVAQIDSDGSTETITYLYTDHLMTNRLGTDEGQAVVWRWEGEAFGETLPEELARIEVNLRFPGQYFDGETNLHYNYYRYYDPQLGRYITADPIGLLREYIAPQLQVAINYGALEETGFAGEQLNHLYSYVAQNPLYWFDPFGLAKGGKQNKRDSGFEGKTDAEIAAQARNPNIDKKDRRKAQTEEKARKKRQSTQSKRSGLTPEQKLGLGLAGLGIVACILFPEVCIPAAACAAAAQ